MKFILRPLSTALNSFLKLDPFSKDRLQKLNGKVVTIELLPLHLKFVCVFSENGIELKDDDVNADTQIIGTPLQMIGVMLHKTNRQKFFSDDVKIIGDAELGQQVIELFDELQIDWEEQSSKIIGDVPTQQISQIVHGAKKWLDDAGLSIRQNVTDYVQEEKQWLPARAELEDFFNDIDSVRMDTDRLEARVNQLKKDYEDKK